MSQDIVSDTLNQMMNALKAGKKTIAVAKQSKLLTSVLALAKLKGYVKDYKTEGDKLVITVGNLNGCNAIKPRYLISVSEIDKFVRRYLPARDIGMLVMSTSQGLMTHKTALEKNIGGSLIAYMF